MVATASFRRNIILASAALLTLFGTFFFGVNFSRVRSASLDYFYPIESTPHLHVVSPATASNDNFCKLLLSSGIVGYPEPIFLGWDGHGMWNGTESHLFKISETLAYLRGLHPSQDDDLVLLLDAYDIWLQLPPEVLIKRYFKTIQQLNERLQTEGLYGQVVDGVQIKQSVLFGADKICWPQPFTEAACWAVPNSTMDPHIFGPNTDDGMLKNRPRWLNSGTIMGPVKDMRDLFSATMDMISRKFDEGFVNHNSDQYYFSELFAEQEVRRTIIRDGNITKYRENSVVPNVPTDRRTEFGVALDYGTDLFLTAGAYDMALTWMRYNHSTPLTLQQPVRRSRRYDEWTLPADVLAAPGPFAAADAFANLPIHFTWSDVMLGTNTISGDVFPLLHMTGDKSYRDRWWPRLWFHPHGEGLLRAKKRQQALSPDPDVFATIDGVEWRGVRPVHAGAWNHVEMNTRHQKGGAWSDHGEFLPWERLCEHYEEKNLYLDQERNA